MKKTIFLTLIALVAFATATAQGRLDMRINEVMVVDETNLIDEYGNHAAWIELYNASHGSNGIEKMFITNDPSYKGKTKVNPYKEKEKEAFHEIRRGDGATKIAPCSHVVFYADGDSARGTFHLPFKLEQGKDNFVAIYDVNGDLVDQVIVPASLPANQSFARLAEGDINLHKQSREFDAKEWSVRDGKSDATAITPGKFNARPVNDNIEKFYVNDRGGGILTLFAMGIVFSALALLFICFLLFGKAFEASEKRAKAALGEGHTTEHEHNAQPGSNDEAIAAICMALYQHLNAHDVESGILTFNHAHEMPSAWESKGNLLPHVPEVHES